MAGRTTTTTTTVSPGDERVQRQRVRRIPIADLQTGSFAQKRCIQGVITLCEPVPNDKEGKLRRTFWLRDIAVCTDNAIAAAGLDPEQSEHVREDQIKRRKQSTPSIHTIPVTLYGSIARVPLASGDIVLIRGSDVMVLATETHRVSDHEFEIAVESGGDCVVEVISAKLLKAKEAPLDTTSYEPTVAIYSFDEQGKLQHARKDVRQRLLGVTYTRLGDLKGGMLQQNVYGILSNMVFPSKTSSGTYRVAFLLSDESPGTLAYPVEACAFPNEGTVLNFLPRMSCFGTIVRLHRVAVKEFNSKPSITLTKRVSTMSITSLTPGDRTVEHINHNGTVSKSDFDWERVEQLRAFGARVLVENPRPEFLYNQYLRNVTNSMQGPQYETPIVDVLAQVVTIPPPPPSVDEQDNAMLEFAVTDGTTQAMVRLQPEETTGEEENFFWELICRYVGSSPGAWIKIRDCQVVRTSGTLLARSGMNKGSKPTTFLEVPSQICLPLQPVEAPVFSLSGSKKVISRVLGVSDNLSQKTLADVLSRTGDPPHRVLVRVTAIFPAEVSQLCKKRAQGLFTWTVALQLQDMTGRVDAVLAGDDATEFFHLEPMNLAENDEARRIVEIAVKAMRQEGAWLDCALTPLTPDAKVFSIIDTSFDI